MFKLRHSLLFMFFLLSFVSCQSDDVSESADGPEAKTNVLFSVDLDPNKYNGSIQSYLAAYTPEGKLLQYGCLVDSTKWDLKAKYEGSKIDIVYITVVNTQTIYVDHIKNVNVGQTFTDSNRIVGDYQETGTKVLKFKVEDFGNRTDNTTSTDLEIKIPHIGRSGWATWNQFTWDKIEEGYGFENVTLYYNNDPKEKIHGAQMVLFERGTNTPYVKYLDLTALAKSNAGDELITLNKSDFTAAEKKTIQVNAKSDDYWNMFFYTYNSKADRREMITYFNNIDQGDKIWYITGTDELPISYWDFIYSAKEKNTSYSIRSTKKDIPGTFDIKELTGQTITKTGDQYKLTHSAVFPDKKLVRSTINFNTFRTTGSGISYNIHFEGAESIGTVNVAPFKIPEALLKKYEKFAGYNPDWIVGEYSQIYTNAPKNSTLDFFKQEVIQWIDMNKPSTEDFTYERFSVKL